MQRQLQKGFNPTWLKIGLFLLMPFSYIFQCNAQQIRRLAEADSQLIIQYQTELNQLEKQPNSVGESVYKAAELFTGTDYLSALPKDVPTKQKPIVCLRKVDCVSLLENALALHRTKGTPTLSAVDTFLSVSRQLKYRHGKPIGYASRLHYYGEWIEQGIQKRYFSLLGPDSLYQENERKLGLLSKDLVLPDSLKSQMREIEARLNKTPLKLIPSDKVLAAYPHIQQGDIIFFAAKRPTGLDFGHAGILNKSSQGEVELLHASKDNSRVENFSSLLKYLKTHPRFYGFVLLRPL